jgi:hypothetical protein
MSKLSDFPGNPDSPALIFVPELINLQGLSEPVRIGRDAVLLRAPDDIRAGVKLILDPFVRTRRAGHVNPWEFQEVVDDQGSTRFTQILDPSEHQFWIIQHWRRLFDQQLQHALELADPGLTPVMALLSPRPMSSGSIDSHAILNWLDENWLAQRRDIGSAQIASIDRAWQLLIDFAPCDEPSLAFIKRAIQEFADLKRVSARMPIYVVGLFSIVEMLLTTQQEKTTENSLSHQLREKLTLFGNRFTEPLVLTNYFPKAGAITFRSFVSKLYSYRGKIAHGSEIDFDRGELQALESHKAVCEFLRAVVRKLILQAVQEPDLFRDLKSC